MMLVSLLFCNLAKFSAKKKLFRHPLVSNGLTSREQVTKKSLVHDQEEFNDVVTDDVGKQGLLHDSINFVWLGRCINAS